MLIYVNTAHRLAELDVKLDQPMLGETDDEATPDEDDATPPPGAQAMLRYAE